MTTGEPSDRTPVAAPGAVASDSVGHRAGTVSRRTMLGAGALGAGLFAGRITRSTGSSTLDDVAHAAAERALLALTAPDLVLHVERDTDLLLLDFEFFDFRLDTKSSPRTLRPTSAANCIVVIVPPQSIGEAVYPFPYSAKVPGMIVDPAPILTAVAAPSRICFTLTRSQSIPLPTMSAQDLLDWDGWPIATSAGSVLTTGSAPSSPQSPNRFQTLIEAPYGLYLSPVIDHRTARLGVGVTTTRFRHPAEPLTQDGVTSCWSTTLTSTERVMLRTGGVTDVATTPQVAAVGARDYAPRAADATPETQIVY